MSAVQPPEGPPVKGFVENGAWQWRLVDGFEQAETHDGRFVHRWPAVERKVVEVPKELFSRNYNAVIEWARAQA
ncbi:hypothetical protein [Lysobacter sp. Hz 25]|uniref:hypothetical protein n=1 Tax=Lysobacter sp. Hz 25 TaxID=3383698 RepID=UPI0038D359B3